MSSMKRTLIVGNWKMHLNVQEASLLVRRLHQHIPTHRSVEVVLAPSMLCLQPVSMEIDRHKFRLSAQNAYHRDDGAFTGEVSFTMLRELVHYSIIGHSERRIYFGETLEIVRDKVSAAVRNGIAPIICVGDTAAERANHESKKVVHDQVVSALHGLTSQEIDDVVIAYEPIWAISTFGGEVARPEDMQAMLVYIRQVVADLFGKQAAEELRLLYGGSVNQDTAHSYLELPDCNGALVGSASLNYQQFANIVAAGYQANYEKQE
ncbi:MAG: tpiA [Candidatus Saccharibacteria bacterium]|nr:tpiA [Candidatus Saccharibacteria bacterium]